MKMTYKERAPYATCVLSFDNLPSWNMLESSLRSNLEMRMSDYHVPIDGRNKLTFRKGQISSAFCALKL